MKFPASYVRMSEPALRKLLSQRKLPLGYAENLIAEVAAARKDKRVGHSKTALARGASVSWLHEQEKIRIAEERFARLEAGQSRTYSLAEVKRELVL